jgi:hypothetical protein
MSVAAGIWAHKPARYLWIAGLAGVFLWKLPLALARSMF